MPNTKSAIRRVRRVKIQTITNKIRKSKYRALVKQMNLLVSNNKKSEAKTLFSKFNSQLMKIAKTGVINKKTASRNISRISKRISTLK